MAGLAEFLAMGGYAFYVWTAFGAAAALMAGLAAATLVQYRNARRELTRLQGRAEEPSA